LPKSTAPGSQSPPALQKKEPIKITQKITRAHAAMLRVRVIVIPLEMGDLLIRITRVYAAMLRVTASASA
jgi:hypothetical protein